MGNTPAVDFLRESRHDEALVKILSLGCGDPRSIMYTLWRERGFGERISIYDGLRALMVFLACRNAEIVRDRNLRSRAGCSWYVIINN